MSFKNFYYLKEAEEQEDRDLNTELGTYKQNVGEIKRDLSRLVDHPEYSKFVDKLKEIETAFDISKGTAKASDIKTINNDVRFLKGAVVKAIRPSPKLHIGGARLSNALEKGKVQVDANNNVIGIDKPAEVKPKTGIEKLAAKLAGLNKPKEPELSVAASDDVKPDFLNTSTKTTSLLSQEKLLDANKETIPQELYDAAKLAIQLANSSGLEQDVKDAEEKINIALDAA